LPIHERKIFTKKLIEEDEFRPKPRQELEHKYQLTQHTKQKLNPFIVNNSNQNQAKVTSVEIIGVNNTKQKQLKTPESTEDENLTERQYNQIIENLTKQYTSHKRTDIKTSNENRLASSLAAATPMPLAITRITTSFHPISSTPIKNDKVNLHDFSITNEIQNRKKQTNANVNKAYQILQNSRLQGRDQIKSRPNSPDLSINLLKKSNNEENKIVKLLNQTSRTNTQSSISKTIPISNAIKNAKLKTSREVEPMFIHIATSIGPMTRYNPIGRQYEYDRSLHNPSFSTLPDNPVPSRMY
jgi:hypothetical protein